MQRSDLPSLPKEIAAALAAENRPWVRKRLVAVAAVLKGQGLARAAITAKASLSGIGKWLRLARQGGCAALLHDGRVKRPGPRLTARQSAATRQKIERALRKAPPTVRARRLRAIRLALRGRIEDAARRADVSPRTVLEWLRRFRSHGMDGIPPARAKTPRNFPYDLAGLHARAQEEKNANIRKRILAVAYVAAGVPIAEAAISAGLASQTVYTALRTFRREGYAAFRNKPIPGRALKLSGAQVSAVREHMRAHPEISLRELREMIKARFGISYSPEGIALLATTHLGFIHGMKKRTPGPPAAGAPMNPERVASVCGKPHGVLMSETPVQGT